MCVGVGQDRVLCGVETCKTRQEENRQCAMRFTAALDAPISPGFGRQNRRSSDTLGVEACVVSFRAEVIPGLVGCAWLNGLLWLTC